MWVCKYLRESPLLLLLHIDSEAELLDLGVILCLSFWGAFLLFCVIAAPLCHPTRSAQGFWLLLILTNTCYFIFLFLMVTMPLGVRLVIYSFLSVTSKLWLQTNTKELGFEIYLTVCCRTTEGDDDEISLTCMLYMPSMLTHTAMHCVMMGKCPGKKKSLNNLVFCTYHRVSIQNLRWLQHHLAVIILWGLHHQCIHHWLKLSMYDMTVDMRVLQDYGKIEWKDKLILVLKILASMHIVLFYFF